MAEASQPTPTSGTGGGNKIMARNIMTGVITTVLGATAIYFLGFNHKKSSPDYLTIKDATVSAWKSYETFENTYAENSLSLLKDLNNIGLDEYMNENKRESVKFQKSIEELSKKKNLDKDMQIALERRLENEKMVLPRIETYINDIKKIRNSSQSQEEKNKAAYDLDMKWVGTYNGLFERAVNDINGIAKTLSSRYGEAFSMDNFLVIKIQAQNKRIYDSLNNLKGNVDNNNIKPPAPNDPNNPEIVFITNIIGDWSTKGASIYLKPNGTLFWDPISDEFEDVAGKWKLFDNKLSMIVTNKQGQSVTRVWTITNSKAGSFTMSLDTEPYTVYQMTRKNG